MNVGNSAERKNEGRPRHRWFLEEWVFQLVLVVAVFGVVVDGLLSLGGSSIV